jgi:hypothetical protein
VGLLVLVRPAAAMSGWGVAFDNTFLVARWERPLTELAVNGRLDPVDMREPDPGLSWTRADGWQCLAPEGAYYDGELVPPVPEVAAETGGPVLGAGVSRSHHYRLSFIEGGELRSIAVGPSEDQRSGVFRREMVERWGEPWRNEAAASLRRWAAPFADASYIAIFGALAIEQVEAQYTLFDLLKLFTLVPDGNDADGTDRGFLRDAWWLRDVPDAVYAIEAGNIQHLDLVRPMGDYRHRELVLAFTDRGVGLWNLQESRWEKAPTADLRATLEDLRGRLRRQGWTPSPPPADS